MNNNIKVLDTMWFNDTIGIVKCLDKITNKTKFYIGKGDGLDEQADILHIISHGSKFDVNYLRSFLTNEFN